MVFGKAMSVRQRLAKLGDVVDFQEGYVNPPQTKAEYFDGPIKWLRAVDLNDSFVFETSRTLSEEGYRSAGRSAYLFPPDSLAISKSGTIGRLGIIRDWMCGNRAVINIRPREEVVDTRYVFYALLADRSQIDVLADGSVQRNLYVSQLSNFEMPLPSLSQQRAIAHILVTLDDKIELNRRMNETLEAMAKAIFKDWFVDFGPTRAKAEGREPYLPAELWDMFPNALGDDGKPVGWTTYPLAALACHHRATLSPIAEPERIYEHYSIPAYDAGNQPVLDAGNSIKSNKTIVPDGAVLLSKLNPDIERVWLPNPVGEDPQIASTEFLALTPIAPVTRNVLYCLFKSEHFRVEMAAMVTGTSKSHQRVSPKALLASDVFVSDRKLMSVFDQVVRPSIDGLLSNRLEAVTLAHTRDLLIPKLISGEIRIPQAKELAMRKSANA